MSTRQPSENLSNDEGDDYIEESEEEDEDEHEPAGRLSRLNKPKIAAGSARYKRRKISSKPTKGKGTTKGRNFGKLAQLMNMPLDVFFEITSQLEPLDILQLSRVSKHFRSTFGSQSSRHIWVAARKNIRGIPDCPPDLTELQYASLMFEHNCQACGKSRAQKTDYSLRVRFCGPCFRENVKKGSTIMRPHHRFISDDVLTLLPRSLLKSPYYSHSGTFDPKTNDRTDHYYLPEAEMLIGQWLKLEYDHNAFELFKNRQLALATEMMKSALVLQEWVQVSKTDKYLEDTERASKRESSIKVRLVELGYDSKDFPSHYDSGWYSLVNQPRELTPRIWKIIRPKLEALIAEERVKKQILARDRRLTLRKAEFKPLWKSLVADIRNGQCQNSVFPTFSDACELNTVAEMLADDDVKTTVTEERVLVRKDAIIANIGEYRTRIERQLVKQFVSQQHSHYVITVSEDEELDLSILDRATTLFKCGSWYCKAILPYPDIFEHEHFKEVATLSSYALARLNTEPKVKSTAIMLLKALGLPEDTPATALVDLDRRLTCLCGHPNYSKPLDFGTLVRHYIDENDWYEKMIRIKWTSIEHILQNDHDLTASNPCVTLRSTDDVLSPDQEDRVEDGTNSKEYDQIKYCATCWRSGRTSSTIESEAALVYHMKGKHRREACEGDALTWAERV